MMNFIRTHVSRAHADGVVIGMSGGIDSAVVGALCVNALGPDSVHAFAMPGPGSAPSDLADAKLVCDHLGIPLHERPIASITAGLTGSDAALANAKPRARMMILYTEAQTRNCLVAGTGNKSELLIGYFTKFGDGGVDMMPIGDLYKTQVFALAKELGLPDAIVNKAPSAGLRPGQSDEDDLGISYEHLDLILRGFELNKSHERIAEQTGVPLLEVQRIDAMVRCTEHKRQTPLIPKLGARTVGIDWRRSVHWDN